MRVTWDWGVARETNTIHLDLCMEVDALHTLDCMISINFISESKERAEARAETAGKLGQWTVELVNRETIT